MLCGIIVNVRYIYKEGNRVVNWVVNTGYNIRYLIEWINLFLLELDIFFLLMN